MITLLCFATFTMTDPTRFMLAVTTVSDQNQASALLDRVLKQRLAACVSVQTVVSHYCWEGEQRRDQECQLLFKTSDDQIDALRDLVLAQHPYDCPEWLSWPVDASPGYGRWSLEQLS